MDLLANLSYTCFEDFYIRVEKIKNGWMELCVGNGDKRLNYSASYIGDPLNYLLAAAVSIVENQKSSRIYNGVAYEGEYLFIVHDLEPSLVTWLFKPGNDELTLIIWEDMPTYFEEMIESGFDDIPEEIKMQDIGKDIFLAIEDSPVPFIKALLGAIDSLTCLKRNDVEFSDSEWGHSYSLENVELFKHWLIDKDRA